MLRSTTSSVTISSAMLLGIIASPSVAQMSSFGDPAEQPDPSSARLISEFSELIAGQTSTLGLAFELTPGWHLYWDGQNDTGMPISVSFDGMDEPGDWPLGSILSPTPERHVSPGDLLDHVLSGSPVLLIPITVPADAAGTTVTIRGRASWLVCKESCVLDDESFELTLVVLSEDQAVTASGDAGLIAAARRALPSDENHRPDWIGVSWRGESLHLGTSREGTLEFYPASDSIPIAGLLASGSSSTGSITLSLKKPPSKEHPAVHGVVSLHRPDGTIESAWIRALPPE